MCSIWVKHLEKRKPLYLAFLDHEIVSWLDDLVCSLWPACTWSIHWVDLNVLQYHGQPSAIPCRTPAASLWWLVYAKLWPCLHQSLFLLWTLLLWICKGGVHWMLMIDACCKHKRSFSVKFKHGMTIFINLVSIWTLLRQYLEAVLSPGTIQNNEVVLANVNTFHYLESYLQSDSCSIENVQTRINAVMQWRLSLIHI